MSDDEVFALIVSVVIVFFGVGVVVVPLVSMRLMRRWWGRGAMGLGMGLSLLMLLVVLMTLAAKDVRGDWDYIGLFMVMGGAVETVVLLMMPMVGVSWRDDALERRNGAAVWVVMGAVVGAMLIFCGGNIGEGETIWTTVGPAVVALGVWAVIWMIVEECTRVSEAVTVERDVGSGIRLGAGLVGMGLVLGRAIAGDWVSLEEFWGTLVREGWVALLIGAAVIVMQWRWGPRAGIRGSLKMKVIVPGVVMVAVALVWDIFLGRW